ncbi:MAG: leucine-rich repeat protein [Clostridia bacterium]|nr:leucine-rich repeat protein [Clostridia bacterium]
MKKTAKILFLIASALFYISAVCSCDLANNSLSIDGSTTAYENQNIATHVHSFTEWGVTKLPTCTQRGRKERACDCGEREVESLDAVGHLPGSGVVVKMATKKEDGIEQTRCSVCNMKLSEEKIPATGSIGLAYAPIGNANGEKNWIVTGIGTCQDDDVVIPAVWEGCAVTAIADRAFSGCRGIREITVPSSVTHIGSDVFLGADSLSKVNYNAPYSDIDNPFLHTPSITEIIFNGVAVPQNICNSHSNLKKVTFGESVLTIEKDAFRDCTSLSVLHFSKNLATIEDCAFSGCSALNGINLPDHLTEIKYGAFEECVSLVSVSIPKNVRVLSNDVFKGCVSLKNITLPEQLKSIGDYAFAGCQSLVHIDIPETVISIGNDAFANCASLKKIKIPDGVKEISGRTFSGCVSLKEITLGGEITSIGTLAFYQCESLGAFTVGENLASIGNGAFDGCDSLYEISFIGTKAQWEFMTKISDRAWSSGSQISIVRCTDGVIYL